MRKRFLYAWVCRRRCTSLVNWLRNAHPKPGAAIYRAPMCRCGVPMQPDTTQAGGGKVEDESMPLYVRRML